MNRLILQLGHSKIIIFLIIVIGGVVGYMNYTGLDEVPISENPVSGRSSVASFADFELDFSILEDQRYKSLEVFGENPVDPGVTGEKRNPFARFIKHGY